MLLNLAMIKDKLPSSCILQASVKKEHPRNLKQVRFYEKDQILSPDILYLASAEDLPVTPEVEQISLLCLGYLPAGYVNKDGVEFLCFRSSEAGQSLFQTVLDIFYYYEAFDNRIKDMIIAGRQMRDFQGIALEIFETLVTVYGTYEKVLMMAYDPNRTENLEYYQKSQDGYMEEEEKSVLYASKDFIDTFSVRGAAFSSMELYKTQIIFYNIFLQDNYLGRLIIENTYREFREGDYALVAWFGEYMRILMNRNRAFRFPASLEFEQMIYDLSLSRGKYREEYNATLAEAGWEPEDRYVCIAITVNNDSVEDAVLQDGAHYLVEFFDSQYIFLHQGYLVQILNINRSSFSYEEMLRRMKIFLSNNALEAGTSTIFQDFREMQIYVGQAMMMADYALRDRQKKLYEFDENVLPMMLSFFRKKGETDIYKIRHLQNLYHYDLVNNTELIKTLQCYLQQNLNISETSQAPYIARTTCLYRIRRIQEITHLNLEDPETNLYLRLILQLEQGR